VMNDSVHNIPKRKKIAFLTLVTGLYLVSGWVIAPRLALLVEPFLPEISLWESIVGLLATIILFHLFTTKVCGRWINEWAKRQQENKGR